MLEQSGTTSDSSHPQDHGHGHGHGHGHDHGHGLPSNRDADARALVVAFSITLVFTVAEAIGGWISGSLALLADAGHMFTDTGALGLSLAAIWLTRKPAQRRRTFGLYRAEILAALFNAVTLILICGWIFYEAWERLNRPEPIDSSVMLWIAIAGLGANAATFWVLWRSEGGSLNLRGAMLHVLGDLLGSVGAIGAALAVKYAGWNQADPIASALIAVFIVISAWNLLGETLRVLLEIAPSHIPPQEVVDALKAVPGVIEVHDVHVWTITSGMEAMSGHLRLSTDELSTQRLEETLQQAYVVLKRFHFEHVTLQVEPSKHRHGYGQESTKA